jgi:transcriptional regulator with XRE-family HTH domain
MMVSARSKTDRNNDTAVGARVRALRIQRKMSQEKLGDALGLTFQQVQKYEKGTNRISASRLIAISKILKVPVVHLLGEDALGNKIEVDTNVDSRQRVRIFELLEKLKNPKAEQIVINLLEVLGSNR